MNQKGLTLMEVMVGIALMLIVFIGIFGIIQMSFKMVAQSKARITAASLANEKMEVVRNLPYDDVGTQGGIPAGSLAQTENVVRNGISYTITTAIIYIDDLFDGVFPADAIFTDYKHAKVKVSWGGFLGGEVALQTDVAPKGIEGPTSGGILSILVFDASGQPISQADIRVENPSASPPIDQFYQTDANGRIFIPGAPACGVCYKITASKADYNTDRTYAVGEMVRGVALTTPAKPDVSVLEGELSEVSFSIDRLSTKTVQSISYTEEITWSDSFENETKIGEKNQVVASSSLNALTLEESAGQYFNSGYAISVTITPAGLEEWGRLNWNDSTPITTDVKYQLLYASTSGWEMIPDSDLTVGGVTNSSGFSDSPVDLSDLDPLKYSSVRIKANFSTLDQAQTPVLSDWEITWFSSVTSIPIANLAFSMQGAKSLGTDAGGQLIYKYSENLSTDGSGQLIISDLEWDSYIISVSPATGYDIANSSPHQPVNVNPGANQTTVLKLAANTVNTFLVTVEDAGGLPLVGATARLYKVGYDKTKLTSDSGQAFFGALSAVAYTLEIKMAGFQDYLGNIDIAGETQQTIILTPP